MTFESRERERQKAVWAAAYTGQQLLSSGVQLGQPFASLNITPDVRDHALWYFARERGIVWHQHANHALSSQAACVNFLMPLATRPKLLAEVIGRALGAEIEMLPLADKGPGGRDWYVDFEWPGRKDYLGEWGKGVAVRGQNATNADAMVQFDAGSGRETLLVEWKYTESYGKPAAAWIKGHPTRVARYRDKAFDPQGPIRGDLGLTVEDFFFEPIYQLFRQQMLAWQMQRAKEDGARRVRVLHISPKANLALHRITAPALASRGADVFEAFRSVLVDPDAFIPRTAEALFGPLLDGGDHDDATRAWLADLGGRYTFLADDGRP